LESPIASKKLKRCIVEESPTSPKSEVSNKFEIGKIKEEMGVNEFQVVSYGLKILIINDSQHNFFPVLGVSVSEFHYSYDMNETQKAGQT
jgi:hypothetical protein